MSTDNNDNSAKGSPTTSPAAGPGSTPTNPPPAAPNTGPRSGPEHQPAVPPAVPPPKPAPKNPGLVTITVDGHEVAVKPGTNMVEAAKKAGSDIPYYCYHPRLSIAANCRMCLVEVSNAPKLVPACQTPLVEGQVIKTTTAKVRDQQRALMEFLLLNHPVDCAICDQAGECKLQDYYMRYNHQPSRLEGGKVLKDKRKVLGPLVVLDQERCILCTRCVRVMSEVAKEPQLAVFGRGSAERIDVFPGSQLDSNYSGNTVDVCPVGALLNTDYRFRARTWFLSAAPSVCTGCSRGCSTYVDFMGQDIYRYRPRENEAINESWMCDQGRLSYKALNLARVHRALFGRGAEVQETTREEALKQAALKLAPFAGSSKLAVMVSPVLSNEDLLAGLRYAKEGLRVSSIHVSGRPAGAADHFLMTADKNPNRRGLEWIAKSLGLALKPFEDLTQNVKDGQVKALFALGHEVPTDAAAFATLAETKLDLFVLQATNVSPLTAAAHVVLPATVHIEDEGTFVNLDGIIQRVRKAYPAREDAVPHWRLAAELLRLTGVENAYGSSRDVWKALSGNVPELAAFEWDKQAPINQRKPGINPLASGADGRPAGYREFGTPRVRGI